MSGTRDVTLDIARGIAIVAIVLGHVGRGLGDAGILDTGPADALDRALYFTHLTVFVFVSGLLTPASVASRSKVAWVLQRVRLFLYLYVVWSLIQGIVRVALAGYTNTVVTWGDLLQLWVPRGHLWFLPFMAVASLAVVLARPWVPGMRWTVILGTAVSLTLWGVSGPWVFTQGWALFGALLLGAAIGRRPLILGLSRIKSPVLAVLGAGGLLAYGLLLTTPAEPPTYFQPARSLTQVLLGAMVSVLGLAVVLVVSALLARTAVSGPVAALGRQSLSIYLAHILAASGFRIIVSGFGYEDQVLHLVGGVVAGILLPLLLTRVARYPWVGWLLSDSLLRTRTPDPALRQGGQG